MICWITLTRHEPLVDSAQQQQRVGKDTQLTNDNNLSDDDDRWCNFIIMDHFTQISRGCTCLGSTNTNTTIQIGMQLLHFSHLNMETATVRALYVFARGDNCLLHPSPSQQWSCDLVIIMSPIISNHADSPRSNENNDVDDDFAKTMATSSAELGVKTVAQQRSTSRQVGRDLRTLLSGKVCVDLIWAGN